MTWLVRRGGVANLTTVMTGDETETTKSYDTIRLGIDTHAKGYYVTRQLNTRPCRKRCRRWTFEALVRFVHCRRADPGAAAGRCYGLGESNRQFGRAATGSMSESIEHYDHDWHHQGLANR